MTVETDIHNFIHILEKELYDDNSLKMYGVNNDDIIQLLKNIYYNLNKWLTTVKQSIILRLTDVERTGEGKQ